MISKKISDNKMSINILIRIIYIWLLSAFMFTSVYSTDISVESKMSFDNYNLYYKYNSLKVGDISSEFGKFTFEGFYDDYGLSDRFNGIKKFSGGLLGSRLYLDNNYDNLYYHFGIGIENIESIKDNLFYIVALAYLIPINTESNIVLNLKLDQSRFQMNPFASNLGIMNQRVNFSSKLKLSNVIIEASYLINYIDKMDVPKNLLMNEGLIHKIPQNEISSFYVYAYTGIYKSINMGLVLSASDSEINVYQPTFQSPTENLYTYFPYFTPMSSKALSLLLITDQDLEIGEVNLGNISFKAQIPVISSVELLYEVEEGEITPDDNVYYDYSGVEPLKIELLYNKAIGTTGYSFAIGYSYFDKPYITNAYFGDALNGYKNHQLTFKLIKSL